MHRIPSGLSFQVADAHNLQCQRFTVPAIVTQDIVALPCAAQIRAKDFNQRRNGCPKRRPRSDPGEPSESSTPTCKTAPPMSFFAFFAIAVKAELLLCSWQLHGACIVYLPRFLCFSAHLGPRTIGGGAAAAEPAHPPVSAHSRWARETPPRIGQTN
jgi:hypothetical protein